MRKLIFITLVLFLSLEINAQELKEVQKQALVHFNAGRFGEAIDLLNKFISANPRFYEGYYYRGLAFEQRGQFESAVIDLRKALKLKPTSGKVKKELNRVIELWYAELRDKIKGHKREIAIDPSNPVNYLEIGKSLKKMDKWLEAEEWYDKYLERDPNASADEIIRYTEILAKNKHIKKGQEILKKWVEKYPDDWRLLSKYGYFSLWLGKRKIAKNAFEDALKIKPYFKEAQEGLEKAIRKPYVTDLDQGRVKEFPIDRYYRLLRKNPDNDEIRFKLVKELVKAKRVEEAYQQLQILSRNHSEEERFIKEWDFVTNYRQKLYDSRVEKYRALIEKNPKNVQAVKKLSESYEMLEDYDSALGVIDDYLSLVPDANDPELIFQYAKLSAWNKDYDLANEKMDELLSKYPDNLKFQLFKAQISVWQKTSLDLAETYLSNYLDKYPNNLAALVSMGSLYLAKEDVEKAKEYHERAKSVNEFDPSVVQLGSNIDFFYEVMAERERYKDLEKARELFLDGDCASAAELYEKYINSTEPSEIVLKEYGDANFCAENYEKAIEIYSAILENNYNPNVAIQRAKVYYSMGDSLKAVEEFKNIVDRDPEDFQANLFLGDAYVKLEEYDSARAVYDSLLTWELDSTEIELVKMRLKWVPATGLLGILEEFPNYVGLQPSASFYSDNLSFRIVNAGGRVELGLTPSVSLGFGYRKSFIKGSETGRDKVKKDVDTEITDFSGSIFARFSKRLTGGVTFGTMNIKNASKKESQMAFLNYEVEKKLKVRGSFNKSDAAVLLYSPYLVTKRLDAEIYKLEGFYEIPQGIKFSGYFQYLTVSDGNKGNDFRLRAGKRILDDLVAGYEYYYANWRFDSKDYYSPINGFESHAAWAEWEVERKDEYSVFLGAKLGYVPKSDYVIREIQAEADYKLFNKLSIIGKISVGSTYKYDDSYTYVSGLISAFYSL